MQEDRQGVILRIDKCGECGGCEVTYRRSGLCGDCKHWMPDTEEGGGAGFCNKVPFGATFFCGRFEFSFDGRPNRASRYGRYLNCFERKEYNYNAGSGEKEDKELCSNGGDGNSDRDD